MPEIAQLATLASEIQALDDRKVEAETAVRDLGRAQSKIDVDVEQVRSRAARDQQRLASGQGSPKELMDLQVEIESLARRQATLEDEELEIMQSAEDAQATLSSVATELAAKTSERDAAAEAKAAAEASIDTDVTTVTASREVLAPTLPADLVKLYETIRAREAGVGAAKLHRMRCEGCHLELGASEIRALREAAPELVTRCENCGRILVRTPESGL